MELRALIKIIINIFDCFAKLCFRKIDGDAELIKHMNNVPGYLQGAERREGASQERALNVGVIGRPKQSPRNGKKKRNESKPFPPAGFQALPPSIYTKCSREKRGGRS